MSSCEIPEIKAKTKLMIDVRPKLYVWEAAKPNTSPCARKQTSLLTSLLQFSDVSFRTFSQLLHKAFTRANMGSSLAKFLDLFNPFPSLLIY
jgi:hypothetical protein